MQTQDLASIFFYNSFSIIIFFQHFLSSIFIYIINIFIFSLHFIFNYLSQYFIFILLLITIFYLYYLSFVILFSYLLRFKKQRCLLMGRMLSREEAWELLTQYNKEQFHLQHAQIVEAVMRYFAEKLGYENEVDFWGIVGLLHDLDFEMYPDEHCRKVQEIMRDLDLDERLIHAVASHGYGIVCDVQPEHPMEKVLYAVDELTGLIGAVVLMRPSKSVMDLEVKSVKKKFKTPKFAAGCSREVIQKGAEMLGWDLDTLIEQTILAMRSWEEKTAKQREMAT